MIESVLTYYRMYRLRSMIGGSKFRSILHLYKKCSLAWLGDRETLLVAAVCHPMSS